MTTPSSEAPSASYPSSARAWWACIVLTMGSFLAFVDRNIISLLVTPIQRDLGLSDTEISVLIGFAFAVFNAVFGLPVARLVDRGTRRTIAGLGIAAWSVATAACGFATNFWQMFLGRMSVGVGEAAVTPAGVSLIADYFPPHRRGLPMGVFYSGLFLGGGAAFVFGGMAWNALGDRQYATVLGPLHSWQLILIGCGVLGAIVTPLTLSLREPQRLDGAGRAVAGGVPIKAVVAFYRRHAHALGSHNIGFCLLNFATLAGAAWTPTLLVRTLDWNIGQAGAVAGAMALVLGPAGSATAGALADALAARGRTDGKLIVCMGSGILCAIAAIVVALNPGQTAILVALSALSFFGAFKVPLAPGALQEIMPNAMRGQAVAIYVCVINLIGGGLSATCVALVTDHVLHDPMKLNQSYGLVGVVVSVLGTLILLSGLGAYRRTFAETRGQPIQAAD